MSHLSRLFAFASCLFAFTLIVSPAPVHADVMISEIMYNPDSSEGRPPKDGQPGEPCRTEWVELYNAGDEIVDISGWFLGDEDGMTGKLPAGTSIEPGEAVVLIPDDCTVADFQAAWGDGFDVYPLSGWGGDGLTNLANGPSRTNEMLVLYTADGAYADEVNYDDDSPWPGDYPDGPSIYVTPGNLTASDNDRGDAWQRSNPGDHGAKTNNAHPPFTGQDAGSPGHVTDQ